MILVSREPALAARAENAALKGCSVWRNVVYRKGHERNRGDMIGGTEFLTIDEAAQYLKVCRKTLYRLLRNGSLRGYRVGRQWRLRRDDLAEWLREQGAQGRERSTAAEVLAALGEVRAAIQEATQRGFSAEEIAAAVREVREEARVQS